MSCCGKRRSLTHKFTILQVHVVGATSSVALRNSNIFALTIVKDFFRKYTKSDPQRVTEFAHNFEHLGVDSRLDIAFEGKPRGFEAPSYKVFTNETPAGTVIFDVETRLIERFIAPGFEYQDLEIERTDYLPTYGGGNISGVSRPGDNTTCTPGPSQVPTEFNKERKGQHRLSTRPLNSGYEVPRPTDIRRPEAYCIRKARIFEPQSVAVNCHLLCIGTV
jgi:hypothetical protein